MRSEKEREREREREIGMLRVSVLNFFYACKGARIRGARKLKFVHAASSLPFIERGRERKRERGRER